MNRLGIAVCIMAAAGTAAMAQQWEVGGTAGAGFLPGVKVTNALGSATAGFQPGVAFGGFIGQNLYPRLSGEIRYGFMMSNLKLESGGTKATFSGQAHVVHYDILYYASGEDSRAQYFVAGGGGMKVFRGTGREAAYQPLSQYAYLTRTQQVTPLVSFGAGVKTKLRDRVFLRVEFRDYLTTFPKEVITPAPGGKVGRMLHNFVPMVSISYGY